MSLPVKYVDANILYPMFGISKKRFERYTEEGTTGSKLLNYCLHLLEAMEKKEVILLVSDLGILETIGVASRDIGIVKARRILEGIHAQKNLEIIKSDQLNWMLAYNLTMNTRIEARDSLHLSNALLTTLVTDLVTCDRDFGERAAAITTKISQSIEFNPIPEKWYNLENGNDLIKELLNQREKQLQIELVEVEN